MSKKNKIETTEEFIARGGKVTKLPQQKIVNKVEPMSTASKGPVTILTYDEANLYYGDKEKQAKSIKPKSTKPKIDLQALPENIRKKILERFKENYGDNNEEKAQDFESEEN